jgi:predicted aspartyl protease
MRVKGTGRVKQVPIRFQVINDEGLIRAEHGLIAPSQVRRMSVIGAVDPRVCHLVLPESVVKRLDLRRVGKVKVLKRGRQVAKWDQVQAHLEVLGRQGTYSASVDPKRRTALIGFLVLEDLDLLVDCTHQRLVPRSKRFITVEID